MDGYRDFIICYEGSLTPAACRDLIAAFEGDSASHRPGVTVAGFLPDVKLTTDLVVNPASPCWRDLDALLYRTLGEALPKYREDIPRDYDLKAYLSGPLTDGGFLMKKYEADEGFYDWHNDFDVKPDGKWRVLTFLWYLNDVPEGGETEFVDGTKIRAEAGKLLLFPATWSLRHRGNRPRGTFKYILTGWLYTEMTGPNRSSSG